MLWLRIPRSVPKHPDMKYVDKLIIAIALLALAGCRTDPWVHNRVVSSAHVNSAPVNSRETFAVIPVAVDTKLPPETAGAVVVAAESGIRDALRALGYAETNKETADLVFYMHGKSMMPVAAAKLEYVSTPSQFGMTPTEMEAYSGRRIYVETYDNHTKQQVWMGWIECTCQDMEPAWISHEIQRIVAKFPPRNGNMTLEQKDSSKITKL
jgi:hypothetical protein